ncbi:DNA-binding response regulator [Microbulbifer agarilyticus]|uniref:DNA-binding response regulator n=1 Tax=Microbulbifer agarilyticus TaxID=260552 RepID=A0A1Q2M9V0_9GAMM|nr:DNA-binding response regulator [Microbulbifer agarilyticus]
MNVLLVEDSKNVAEVIFDYFEESAITLDYAATGTSGLNLARSKKYDCIVMDLMLPGLDGLKVCELLREDGNNTPIIMLTARDTDADMLSGFKQGADDYIVKPFNIELLEARIHSLVKRYSGQGYKTILASGDLKLDLTTHQVWRNGNEIRLSPSCFKILQVLMERSPEVVTREEIEGMLWQDDMPDTDILRKHIYQLRLKIDKPFEDEIIETIPKVGYRLKS